VLGDQRFAQALARLSMIAVIEPPMIGLMEPL